MLVPFLPFFSYIFSDFSLFKFQKQPLFSLYSIINHILYYVPFLKFVLMITTVTCPVSPKFSSCNGNFMPFLCYLMNKNSILIPLVSKDSILITELAQVLTILIPHKVNLNKKMTPICRNSVRIHFIGSNCHS